MYIKYVYRYDMMTASRMETFSALLAICVGNSPVPDEFPAQMPVTSDAITPIMTSL